MLMFWFWGIVREFIRRNDKHFQPDLKGSDEFKAPFLCFLLGQFTLPVQYALPAEQHWSLLVLHHRRTWQFVEKCCNICFVSCEHWRDWTLFFEKSKNSFTIFTGNSGRSDLLDEVTLKSDVFVGFMGQRYRRDVGHPLCLVDDSVGEVQDLPILHLHLAVPNHSAQLLLDLGWEVIRFRRVKVEFWTICASPQKRDSSHTGE